MLKYNSIILEGEMKMVSTTFNVTREDLRRELVLLELRMQGFMIKALMVAVTMIATIQGIIGHFMK